MKAGRILPVSTEHSTMSPETEIKSTLKELWLMGKKSTLFVLNSQLCPSHPWSVCGWEVQWKKMAFTGGIGPQHSLQMELQLEAHSHSWAQRNDRGFLDLFSGWWMRCIRDKWKTGGAGRRERRWAELQQRKGHDVGSHSKSFAWMEIFSKCNCCWISAHVHTESLFTIGSQGLIKLGKNFKVS